MFLGNYISLDKSNGEVCFVIRDLEKFSDFLEQFRQIYCFCHFSEKLKFSKFYIYCPHNLYYYSALSTLVVIYDDKYVNLIILEYIK